MKLEFRCEIKEGNHWCNRDAYYINKMILLYMDAPTYHGMHIGNNRYLVPVCPNHSTYSSSKINPSIHIYLWSIYTYHND